jgi:hypothetical protein
MSPTKMELSAILALLSGAGAAYAQVPRGTWSGNDISDTTYFNTGMGTDALFSVTPTACNGNLHVDGCYNTAAGYKALYFDSIGDNNTASGYEALYNNTTGYGNVATGVNALYNNTEGNYDTAIGTGSLYFNTQGSNNTAVGSAALNFNTTGNGNTATGSSTLNYNTTGSYNTANGNGALFNNTTGYSNTATGGSALEANTTGSSNTASGSGALALNTAGSNMVAVGLGALQNVNLVAQSPNTTVPGNMTAIGYQALSNDTTGVDNIALGYEAGFHVTTGGNNIHIGNEGTAADNKVIKIGTEGTQKKTIIAGIYSNTTVSGLAVVIGSTGELGVVASSERLKTDIATMGSATEKLQQLRPVTFHYKNDQQGELRYGLIAEEVAKAYPELVVRDESGRIDGVRYDELAPMLLNEMQREHSALVAQHEADVARIGALEKKVAEVDELKQQLSVVIEELKARDKLVAQR